MGASEISSIDLVRALEAEEPFQVLDIRAPQRLADGKIDIVPEERFFNVPGSRLYPLADPRETGLDPDLPVAVVCGQGNSSRQMAAYLQRRGFEARSLVGGMADWMHALVPRELEPPDGFERLVQLDRVGKGSLGYVVAGGGEALVIDPSRRLEAFLEPARSARARVVAVVDTHAHADYISGGAAMARELGVPYHLHPKDAVDPYEGRHARMPFRPVEEGSLLSVGGTEVRVAWTPGHTEGSVSLLAPDVAFTGDFLLVRSVGRPDLGGREEEWTGLLWWSLERARREWPEETVVCPAHYASAAERRPDGAVAARLERLAEVNEPFAMREEGELRRWIAERRAPFPDAYRRIKRINLGLLATDPEEADLLEAGRNECAAG